MLAGTTHDTKRAEDVRALGLALAAHPDRWLGLLDAWTAGPGRRPRRRRRRRRGWPCRRWSRRPGIDADRLRRVPRQGGPRGRSAGRRGPIRRRRRRTAWPVWPPRRRLVAGAGLHRRRSPRHGRAAAAGAARRAAHRARRARPVPGHRGVPLRARRPRQPGRARPRPSSTRSSPAPPRSTPPAAWGEPDAAAARAVVIARVLAARRWLVLTGYRALPAPHGIIAFARLDDSGAPRLVTIVPRVVPRPGDRLRRAAAGPWRSVLVDDCRRRRG